MQYMYAILVSLYFQLRNYEIWSCEDAFTPTLDIGSICGTIGEIITASKAAISPELHLK